MAFSFCPMGIMSNYNLVSNFLVLSDFEIPTTYFHPPQYSSSPILSSFSRIDVGNENEIYRVINRANGRVQRFHSDKDCKHFEKILNSKLKKVPDTISAVIRKGKPTESVGLPA